ncbi:VirD4-like conjugal transfer protein, CD1115 family [Peptococcus simiae]|uniref:VirD4-like conjugal transfer protein, CD1115 family n=1 Tax=Peptococcus simiae TaxID=1643805 RepID=A0ABW9H1M7_9FIRM
MGGDKNQQKRSVFGIVIFTQIVAVYFSLVLASIFFWQEQTYNPFKLMAQCRIEGFPFRIFAILEVLLLGFMIYGFYDFRVKYSSDLLGRNFRLPKERNSYGESHFETPEEFKKAALVQKPEDAYGTIYGQMDKSGKELINRRMDSTNRLNSHIAVVGASGTGKTYTFTKNFIFQAVKRRESLILTDPDGGLFRDTAGYLEDNGYIVRRLDLTKLWLSDGWDCMKSIKPESVELDAQFFAQTVISNVSDDMTSIYSTGPLSLLKALVLRVFLGPDFKTKDISTVYGLIQNEGGEAYLDKLFNPDYMPIEARPALGPYLSFKQGSPNLRGNLITNLATQLQILQSGTVGSVLSQDDIDLELPGKELCAYYCIFPDSHDTYRFITSLFFSMLTTRLVSLADEQEANEYHGAGELPVPVNFLLDEFPSIGMLPDWDRKMSTIRKRRINATMIFQDITQLQNLYPNTWVTILANCSTMISLGINDQYTSDLFTKRLGNMTVEAKTDQYMRDFSRSMMGMTGMDTHSRSSIGEGRRALLSLDELFKVDEDRLLIVFQGHDPILAYKYPHVLHPEAKKLRKIYQADLAPFWDVEARKRRKEEEQIRLEEYYKNHPRAFEVDRSYEQPGLSSMGASAFNRLSDLKEEFVERFIENPTRGKKPAQFKEKSDLKGDKSMTDFKGWISDFKPLNTDLVEEKSSFQLESKVKTTGSHEKTGKTTRVVEKKVVAPVKKEKPVEVHPKEAEPVIFKEISTDKKEKYKAQEKIEDKPKSFPKARNVGFAIGTGADDKEAKSSEIANPFG